MTPQPSGAPLRPLTDQERNKDLERILDTRPPDGDVRIFAYGSLIWNPCFAYGAQTVARLNGYRRAFNFRSVVSRGTPENPGLGLGLEPGGDCHGVAFRLKAETLRADLEALWRREMYYDVYRSHWHALETPNGPVTAIVFVTNPDHPGYAGNLRADETVRIIRQAAGENGTCRDYLAETVAALAEHGIEDESLSVLLKEVDNPAIE